MLWFPGSRRRVMDQFCSCKPWKGSSSKDTADNGVQTPASLSSYSTATPLCSFGLSTCRNSMFTSLWSLLGVLQCPECFCVPAEQSPFLRKCSGCADSPAGFHTHCCLNQLGCSFLWFDFRFLFFTGLVSSDILCAIRGVWYSG